MNLASEDHSDRPASAPPTTEETPDPASPAIGWWGWTWRSGLVVLVAMALYVGVRLTYEQLAAPLYAPVPAMTVGHDTTRIDGPLDEDGYVDYVAALEEESRRGVTPEENGATVFYQIVGPASIPAAQREDFFGRLGIAVPPEEGNYLVDPIKEDTAQRVPGWDPVGREREFLDAGFRVWRREEFPEVAAWVDANKELLDRLAAASRRPRWYVPMLMGDASQAKCLINWEKFHAAELRHADRALARRAMLRLGEGDFVGAAEDAEAIDRLAALAAQGPSVYEWLLQITIRSIADNLFEALARDLRMEPSVRLALRERQRLRPACANFADRIDRGERFQDLDNVRSATLMVYPQGLPAQIDWNEALREINPHFDSYVQAFRVPDRRQRRAAVAAAEKEQDDFIAERASPQYWALAWLSGESLRTLRGRGTGSILVMMSFPSVLADEETLWQMKHDGIDLMFALAEFHAKHGRYPNALADLVPEHVKELPDDFFAPAPRPMAYVKTTDGYVLFSHDGPTPATAPPEPESHAHRQQLIFRVPWREADH